MENRTCSKKREVVRKLANAFRKNKTSLVKLISWEMGKIQAEGEGEVQIALLNDKKLIASNSIKIISNQQN